MIATYEDDVARAPDKRMRIEAQRDHARLAVLAEVGQLLASSGDCSSVLQQLTDVAVPVLGEWCSVDVADVRVALTGPDGSEDSRVEIALVARGKVLGTLTFGRAEREFDRDDLAFGTELARRIAMFVDNAQLLREVQTREVALHELEQFAYVTSHDLRAPLRGIANLATWIEEDLGERLSEAGREHLRLLRSRVRRLEDIIQGVLDYSRAGRSGDEPVDVDVGALAREVVELLAPPPHVSIHIAPDLPTLRSARVPLQQVMLNLVSNALKYNDSAQPRIDIGAEPTASGWEIYVRDNGPGIAPRHQAQIWGLFQTLVSRDKLESTGIGLAVVRKIVEAHGGRVWVESAEGKGATFRFTWPRG